MSHIVHVGLALPHTVFPALCTPRTERQRREAEVGCQDWLTSPDSASATQQQKRTVRSGSLAFPEPIGWSQSLIVWRRSHTLLPAHLPDNHSYESLCMPRY